MVYKMPENETRSMTALSRVRLNPSAESVNCLFQRKAESVRSRCTDVGSGEDS